MSKRVFFVKEFVDDSHNVSYPYAFNMECSLETVRDDFYLQWFNILLWQLKFNLYYDLKEWNDL